MPIQINAWSYWQAGDENKTIVTDGEAFERMVSHLQSAPALTLDYETSGLAWHAHARSIGVAFATWDDAGRIWNYYVPYRHQTGEPQLEFDRVAPAIKGLLEDESKLKICQNIKFEDHFSRKEGWELRGPRFDTMIASHMYDENMLLKLETRAERILGRTDARRFELEMQKEVLRLARAHKIGIREYKKRHGYEHTPVNLCGTYACFDTDHTTNLYFFYERWGIRSRYPRIWATEMDLTTALCDMEETGLPVNVEYLENLRDSLGGVMAGLEDQIKTLLGPDMFRLASDDELRYFMFEKLSLTPFKKTKGNKASVDREVLEYFKGTHPVLKLLLDWRDAQKLTTTYTDSILTKLDANGIVHPDFQQVGTNTGRLSCKEPNFQNQPVDDDDRALEFSGKKVEDGGIDPWSIRRAFVVRKESNGRVIPRLYFDYSQIELRTIAYYSADPRMTQVYLEGGDIHKTVSEEVDRPRRVAKVINFGLCLAEGQRLLTDRGLVPIEDIKKTDLVWDGVAFVSHSGIAYRGEQEVVTYDGITATPDHEVYTEDGQRAKIGCLASSLDPRRIAIGAVGAVPVRYSAFDRKVGYENTWFPTTGEGCGSCLHCLRQKEVGSGLQLEGWQECDLFMPAGEIPRSTSPILGGALRRYGAEVLQRYACFIASLQGAWNQGALQIPGRLCFLGSEEMAGFGFQEIGLRSDRQRWALLQAQSAFGRSVNQSAEYNGRKTRKAKVYDILNAGPRRRFTIEGKIVSNSYGLTEMGLARQAKLSPDEAKATLERFFTRFPGILQLRDRLWTSMRMDPESSFVNLFGRQRRVPHINSTEAWEQGRAERQAIGSLIQGTAAELTKESIVRIAKFLREEKLPAKLCNTVHDEIQLDCPAEALVPVVKGVKSRMEDYREFWPIPIVVDGDYTTESWADKQKLPKVA